jgi:hypothetical protein
MGHEGRRGGGGQDRGTSSLVAGGRPLIPKNAFGRVAAPQFRKTPLGGPSLRVLFHARVGLLFASLFFLRICPSSLSSELGKWDYFQFPH